MSLDARKEDNDKEAVDAVSNLSGSDSVDVNDYVDATAANTGLKREDQEQQLEQKEDLKDVDEVVVNNEKEAITPDEEEDKNLNEYKRDVEVVEPTDELVTSEDLPEKSELAGDLPAVQESKEKYEAIEKDQAEKETPEVQIPTEETKGLERPEEGNKKAEDEAPEQDTKEVLSSDEIQDTIKLDKYPSTDSKIDIHDMESIDSDQGSVVHYPKEAKPEVPTKWFNFESPTVESKAFNETIKDILLPSNLNLAYHRFEDNEIALQQETSVDRTDIQNSRNNLKKTFDEIKTGVTITQNEDLLGTIDWEFWSEVFNDYSNIVKNKEEELKKNITNGIPNEIRGMVWQIISDSNSMKMKEYFINMKDNKSDFEKLIKRDLSRTSFIKNSNIKEKIDDLFNIIKTYSLYDTEVGYTQGMAFITVPILMNMESDEAFCLLVKLMFQYGFREFYLPEMPGLHLRIYQFDRLIEDRYPDLYLHLKNQKISSSMYAIQWFLTLFAYKFPLDMVLRIFDVVIAEGLESILKFSLNLMIKNKDHLLTLKFDDLLNFLKDKLFYYYSDVPELPDENNKTKNSKTYQIDKFIKDSMEIEILPITLNKYRMEFDEIDRIEKDRENQIIQLQTKNGQLVKEIRKLESLYAILNRDHVEIANEMVNGKLRIGTLEDENKLLNEQINKLQERLSNLKNTSTSSNAIDFTSSNSTIGDGLDKEIQNAMEINLQVMDQNRILEEKLSQLEAENQQLKSGVKPHLGSMFGGLKKPGKFW